PIMPKACLRHDARRACLATLPVKGRVVHHGLRQVVCARRPRRSHVVNAAERLTIARILKVNHAGEHGAIRIYRAQIWVARWLYPDVVAFLEETLAHEVRHCAMFRAAMPARDARPCRIMSLWGNGGFVLGFLTALMGRQGIWICTAAVEAAVHRHLGDQLQFLSERDPELHAL